MRLTLIGPVVAALGLAGVLAAAPAAPPAKATGGALELARQLNQAFIEVADQVSPAVVVIRVAHHGRYLQFEPGENPLWDLLPPNLRQQLEEERRKLEERRNIPRKGQEQEKPKAPAEPPVYDSKGSGVVIRETGFILTNRHVVDDAEKIQVRFKDDSTWYEAQLHGVDAQSDVAVIKVEAKGKKLSVARLGNSETVRVGEFAIAIGAPFELDYSVTFGHISAKGRSGILPDRKMDQDFIQTDADINPGNSGGPLVNIEGEVIGINTLIRGLNTGIGFAIPINLAREIADQLVTEGKFVRAYLGVMIRSLRDEDPDVRNSIKGITDGVVVNEIPTNAPAYKSELKPGDVITGIDGQSIATAQQLKNAIRSKKIGEPVKLDVYRNGRNLKISVRPAAWPDEAVPVVNRKEEPPSAEEARSFGLTLRKATRELAEQMGVEKAEGVIVMEVARGSVGEQKGLRPGDVITDVNYQPVSTLKEFTEAVKKADAKQGVRIIYLSRGTSKFAFLKESGD